MGRGPISANLIWHAFLQNIDKDVILRACVFLCFPYFALRMDTSTTPQNRHPERSALRYIA
jgi:hypothetical protein